MAQSLVTALETALSECALADLSVLSATDVAGLVVDLRRVVTRLEAEIARAVHVVAEGEMWRPSGATSIEVWLAGETNVSVRSARDQVRLADTLAAAPVVAERMAEGGLSIDNARLLGAVVGQPGFAGDAELLLEVASGSPRDTRRGLESWLAMADPAGESDREEALWLKRHLTFTRNGDGMYDVRGLLMPVDVAAVQTALDHIAGAAFADDTGRAHHTRIGDAMVELCKAYNAGTVTGGRERPKVLVAVPFETVVERGAARGVIVGSNDTISGEAVRQLCCDAELNRVVTRGKSTILDYGTTTRLASDAQYYALVARDGGCRWLGCDRPPGWCDVHHLKEVAAENGPTDVNEMVLGCSTHHDYLHHKGWKYVGSADDLYLQRPDGTLIPCPPRGPIFNAPQQLELATT